MALDWYERAFAGPDTDADYLGVARLSFYAALGAKIERGQHHLAVFQTVRPNVDFSALQRERELLDKAYSISVDDFYPDAIACLQLLRESNLLVGIAGNQSVEIEWALRALAVPADIVASSASWGVEKPEVGFFERIVSATNGFEPSEIAYVGDRLDNDIEPARRAGMVPVFLRRGPWALIQSESGRFPVPPYVIDSLLSLPGLLQRL